MKGGIKRKGTLFVFLLLLLAFVSFIYGNYLSGDLEVLGTLIPFMKNVEFPQNQNILVSDIHEEIQYGPSGRGLVSVVQVRDTDSADNGGFWSGSNGYYFEHYDKVAIKEMLNNAVIILSGEANAGDAWNSLVPYVQGEQIALKLNMNCQGSESNYYDANPAFVDAMAEVLNENLGVPLNELYFYDPSHPYPREMKRYRDQYFDNNFYFGRPMNGEDNPYPGFGDDYGGANDPPDDNYINIVTAQTPLGCADTTNGYILDDAGGHPNYIPFVLTEAEHEITISLLKNHGLGEGGTFTMKNQGVGTPQVDINDGSWCGSFSRNSAEQSLHDNHICAAINANEHIHGKTRLAIIDGIYGQLYPHSMAEPEETWSSFGDQPPALILASTDPVAVDSVANYLLEVEDRATYGGTGSVYATADSEGTTWIQCVKYAEEEQGIGVYESWDEIEANGGFVDIDYLIYGEAECEDGQTRDCYDGPEETADVGICHNGTQTCTGGFWGACEGQQLPLQEDCEDLGNEDEDCDGLSNEEDADCLICMFEEIYWGDSNYNLLTDVEEPGEVFMIVNTTACVGLQISLDISEYDGDVLDYDEDNFVENVNSSLELYPWTSIWNLDDDVTPDVSEYRFNATIVGIGEERSGNLNVLEDSTIPVFLDHDGDYDLVNVGPGSTSVVFEWNTSEPTNYTLSINGGVESSEAIFDTFRIVTVSGLLPETSYNYELEVCDNRENCAEDLGVFTTGQPLSNMVLNFTHLEDTYIANTGGHDNDSYGDEDFLHLDGEVGGGGRGNILMRWNVDSLIGAEVENAKLYLYTDDSYPSGIQEYIEIYPLSESRWTENEATFLEWIYSNDQMLNKWSGTDVYSGYSWTLLSPGDYNDTLINGSLHIDDDGEWHVFDVTSLIQGWVDGSFDSDAGMVLFAPNLYGEGSPYYLFASSEYSDVSLRPRIEVEMAGSSSSECQLVGGYWEYDGSNDDVDEGELVELTAFGTDCAGEQISFDIREDDTLGGTDAWEDADIVDIDIYPATVTFEENGALDRVSGSWVAEWHEDDNGGSGDPEYIFRGTLISNSSLVVDSVDELSVNQVVSPGPINTSENLKVAFVGDMTDGGDSEDVFNLIIQEGAEVVLHQGDLIQGAGYDDDPTKPGRWESNINATLGENFSYFALIGNHDIPLWDVAGGYQEKMIDRYNRMVANGKEVVCVGELGEASYCVYEGLFFAQSAIGVLSGQDDSTYVSQLQTDLSNSNNLWKLCAWHKMQEEMQIGGKNDETGWDVYEACKESGALIFSGHEHSYERTHSLRSMENQILADVTSPYIVGPGQTIKAVAGMGGYQLRDQERCEEDPPYGCNGEWASVYTLNQTNFVKKSGALFCTFYVDGDPNKASCYFKNTDGEIIDQYEIINSAELLTCSELGGNVCGEDQTCDGFSVPSSDGDCCMGTCRECDITNAEWSETEVLEGTQVSLNVNGDWCDGQNISFDVREDDQLIGSNWDNADIITLNNPPGNATFSGTQASVSWISEWHDDIDGGDSDPEYVFRTSLESDPLTTRDSSNELKVNEIVSSGDTYYVDDDAVDENGDGSEANPFFYIQDGVNILQAGDTLIIKDGIYYGFSENQEIFDTVNSGTSSNPITIHAENNYQVFIDGSNLSEGYGNVLIDQSYIVLEGIISQNAKQAGIQLWGADHSKVLRCGSSDAKGSASNIGLIDSSYNLVEECFTWGHGRYPIGITSTGDSRYNIIRKNVVRLDYTITHEPKSCYTNYHQSWNFFFNNLCIDSAAEVYYPGTEESNQVPSGFMTSNGFYDLTYRGNIVLNHAGNGYLLEGSDSHDIVLHNNVAWDVKRGGILLVNDLDLALFYFSTSNLDPTEYTFDLEHFTMGNVEGGTCFDAKESQPPLVDVTNSIFYNVDSRTGRPALSGDFESNFNAFFMNDDDRGPAPYGSNDSSEALGNGIDPLSNGLMYLPRIESGSALSGAADDGGDIGATILYQIGESGTLYGEPGWNQIQYDDSLWPWPNQDIIKQMMGNHYRAEGHYLEGPWISCTVDVESNTFNCPGHGFEEDDIISFTATTFPLSYSERLVEGIDDHYVYNVLCVNGDEFTIRTRFGGDCGGSQPDDIVTSGAGIEVALGWNNPIFDGNRGFAAAESLTHYIWEYLGNPCPEEICGESQPECQVDGDCNDGVSCTVDSCVAENCVYTPDNGVCDNGAYCDGAEICDLNLDCQAGVIVDCNDGVSCTVDSCNEGTDSCDNLADDSICDNGLYCDGEDYCSITQDCQVQNIPDCDDTVSCTVDSCNEGADSCENTASDAICDNGQWCDGTETCDLLLDCQAGTSVDCSDAYDCTDDSCNDVLDTCDNIPNDNNCVFPEICNPIYFPPPSGCGEVLECTGQEDGTPCDDGSYCNGPDECVLETCTNAGPPVDCGDGVSCTVDSCNEGTDSCDNLPDDDVCDDGLWCVVGEYCDAQLDCQDGSARDCSDDMDCSVDSCDDVEDECTYDYSGCPSDFTLSLKSGEWNYVSIPVDMDNDEIAQLEASMVLAYDSVSESWLMNFGPFEQINTLDPLKGYAITVSEDKSIGFSGTELNPLPLENDMWNLVGVNDTGLIEDIYEGAGTILVYEWDSVSEDLVLVDPSTELQPGVGYWIGVGDVESPPDEKSSGSAASKIVRGLVRIFGFFTYDLADLPVGNLLLEWN